MLCWAAVLVYSAVVSDTGYRALADLRSEAGALTAQADALRTRRLELEHRADLLKSDALDPDMIDERIRSILGYSQDGDIVVPRKELEPLIAGEN